MSRRIGGRFSHGSFDQSIVNEIGAFMKKILLLLVGLVILCSVLTLFFISPDEYELQLFDRKNGGVTLGIVRHTHKDGTVNVGTWTDYSNTGSILNTYSYDLVSDSYGGVDTHWRDDGSLMSISAKSHNDTDYIHAQYGVPNKPSTTPTLIHWSTADGHEIRIYCNEYGVPAKVESVGEDGYEIDLENVN